MARIRTATGSLAYAKYQLRRSILESALEDNYSDRDHKDALKLFGGCAFCGNKTTSRMDHLVPVISLGDFVRSNVVPACQVCDDSKGQREYHDWMRNSTSPKSLRNRGFSKEQIEDRIDMIEEWQCGYTAKSERELFGRDHGHYIDILNKMDSLCNEARQLVDKVKTQNNKTTEHDGGTTADRIRLYAIGNYINPARKRNEKTVSIRSGDIHSEMKLHGNHANVCQALRGEAFQGLADVKLLSESGPRMGGNTYFRYKI
ncbi:hypothetical protein ES705_37996 [subsurface metagenome]